ncbi:uncharacterized protein LOC136036820 [Artemia franciscana]|uniref:uncharacterized protein LOC136036820 n=1 Tax=Artemia franciscana TaxID=6661 RepID=UPI0032DAD872
MSLQLQESELLMAKRWNFTLRQGSNPGWPVFPALFNYIIEWIIANLLYTYKGFVVGQREDNPIALIDLNFADNVDLMSISLAELQKKVNDVSCTSKKAGLMISKSKTKVMKANAPNHPDIHLEGETIETIK